MATTFTNQASLSLNGASIQSNVATGIVEGALSISKTAVASEYSAGDTVTYVVSIINNSATAMDNLTLSDDLGAYDFNTATVQPLDYVADSLQYYQNGAISPTPTVSTTAGLVITGISVPASGNVTLVYSATLNEFAPLQTDASITNTATISSNALCDAAAAETITASEAPVLAILKSVTPIPVAENGSLTYTFQLQNSGNTAVLGTDNAALSDTFDPLLSNISVVFNGEAMTQGTDYTYNQLTGEFTTLNGAISIPAATFTQDAVTGAWSMTPGTSTLVITGNVGSVCGE